MLSIRPKTVADRLYARYGDERKNHLAEYAVWRAIKQRCCNPTHRKYHCYGGRGIKMCERWRNSFHVFLQDVGPRPSAEYWIERINNDGNYEIGNVKWATAFEQCRNRRQNRNITFNGETLCVTDWAKRIGMSKSTLRDRLASGWSVSDALTLPVQKTGKWLYA